MADCLKPYIKPKIEENVQAQKLKGKKKKNNVVESEDKKALEEGLALPAVPEYKSKKKNRENTSKYLKAFASKVREECWCEAAIHELINNCLNCGRIVCEKEGSGKCFTCGRLVCTDDEMRQLREMNRESEFLFYQLMAGPMCHEDLENEDYFDLQTYFETEDGVYEENEDALALKDRLLQYDTEATKRTHIIDDEADYFNVNSKWMTKTQREHMQKKLKDIQSRKHQSRLDAKYQLNLITGQVEEVKVEVDIENEAKDSVIQEALYGNKQDILEKPFQLLADFDFPAPQFVPSEERNSNYSNRPNNITSEPTHRIPRIQDPELMEMSDEGLVLTLHQPYASLLIAGIKLHEGRDWYSHHRGRLWIHSASKPATKEEIESKENFFRQSMGDVMFPKEYVPGVLLGCVTVKDCLNEEEYKEKFPVGYSTSPYVFICEDPLPLKIKIPMKGSPKIYPLDRKVHKMAKKFLIID